VTPADRAILASACELRISGTSGTSATGGGGTGSSSEADTHAADKGRK